MINVILSIWQGPILKVSILVSGIELVSIAEMHNAFMKNIYIRVY